MSSIQCIGHANLYPDNTIGQFLRRTHRQEHPADTLDQGVIAKQGVSLLLAHERDIAKALANRVHRRLRHRISFPDKGVDRD